MARLLDNATARFLILALACLCGGCMEATYDGKTLTIRKCMWDTKIGKLEATDGTRKLIVENYDSTSQAIGLAEQAVKLAGSAK